MSLGPPFDLANVSPSVAAWAFLGFLAVMGPYGALKAHRRLDAGHTFVRPILYLGVLIWQAMLFLLALGATWTSGMHPFPPIHLSAFDGLVGVASLALGLTTLHPRLRLTSAVGRARMAAMAPRTPKELGLFYVVCVGAGVAEETAYRGVAFALLYLLTGSWWVAAAIAAVIFGATHLAQGWRTAFLVILYGLRDQVVVGLTGSLYVAILVHIVHDAVVGTVVGRRAHAADAPLAG